MALLRRIAITVTCFSGPVVAAFYEAGACCTGGGEDVVIVMGFGAIGAISGAAWVYHGNKLAGIVSVALNSAVTALYGFPLVFFLLGGSR